MNQTSKNLSLTFLSVLGCLIIVANLNALKGDENLVLVNEDACEIGALLVTSEPHSNVLHVSIDDFSGAVDVNILSDTGDLIYQDEYESASSKKFTIGLNEGAYLLELLDDIGNIYTSKISME